MSSVINLALHEKQVFSQNGEDGIIERLFQLIGFSNRYYVEIGVEDGTQCNTRYLREKYQCEGIQLDCAYARPAWGLYQEYVTAENLNSLFAKYQVPQEFDLLSIDVDGHDFYLWWKLDSRYSPRLVIAEYNASHLPDEDKVVTYDSQRRWDGTRYFGASILAWQLLATHKGYHLVYAESQGVNLFFVRQDVLAQLGIRFLHQDDPTHLYRPPAYLGVYPDGQRRPGHPPDPLNCLHRMAKEMLAEATQSSFLIEIPQLIEMLYQTLLQRSADPEGKAHYGETLARSGNLEATLREFIASPEFQQKQALEKLPDAALGILVSTDYYDTRLLYPAYDQIQLPEFLAGRPFQLQDFLTCINFLQGEGYLQDSHKIFLDLGANVGSTTLYALKGNYFTQAISVEASSQNYQFLSYNLQINQLGDRVQALNYGLADFSGQGMIIGNPENCGDFRISPQTPSADFPKDDFNKADDRSEIINFVTLDDLLNRKILHPQATGMIWIDCQGSEGLIFRGGQKFFQQIRVPLYVEFWPYGLSRLGHEHFYFDYLRHFSRGFGHFVEGQFHPLSLIELDNYYHSHRTTEDYIDLLVLPL